MNEKLNSFVLAHQDELIRLLCRLVAARTENPPGNEHLAAEIMRETLDSMGIECLPVERVPGRTNMIARIGEGSPRVLVACHFDVVPAGDGWETDPFTAVMRDGRVIGRGTSDNKGQLAVMLTMARYLKEHQADLIGEVILVGAADEERGSDFGLEWMVEEGLLQADFALIPDIDHRMRRISIAEKGALFLKVIAHGVQAHGSAPQKGINAICGMIDLLNEIRRMDLAAEPSPLFTAPTFNLGMISGGSAPNIVPARCEASLDFRFLPSQSADGIERAVRDAASKIEEAGTGVCFEFERVMAVDPIQVAADHPLVRRLQRAAHDVLGWEPELLGLSGSTIAKPLVRAGIPAVGFGPGEETQAHAANESVAISELIGFAKVLGSFLVKEKR